MFTLMFLNFVSTKQVQRYQGLFILGKGTGSSNVFTYREKQKCDGARSYLPNLPRAIQGEPLLLAGSRLVIKYSASLSNTKSLYTHCASPSVTAGEASACWGRKSELAGRAGRKKRQERVGQEHKSSNVISLRGNSCSFSSQPHKSPLPIRSGSYRGAKQLIPSAQLPNRGCYSTAPVPQAGIQAGAQPVPTMCHGLAPHWSLLLERSRQARGQELLCSSEPTCFKVLVTATKTARAGTRCILGHFEGHVVTSAAGTASAVAQVGTCCWTPQIIADTWLPLPPCSSGHGSQSCQDPASTAGKDI